MDRIKMRMIRKMRTMTKMMMVKMILQEGIDDGGVGDSTGHCSTALVLYRSHHCFDFYHSSCYCSARKPPDSPCLWNVVAQLTITSIPAAKVNTHTRNCSFPKQGDPNIYYGPYYWDL